MEAGSPIETLLRDGPSACSLTVAPPRTLCPLIVRTACVHTERRLRFRSLTKTSTARTGSRRFSLPLFHSLSPHTCSAAMSVTRTLGGPLLGTAAAGLVLYSVGHSLALRTHQVTDALHSSSRNLRRLADVDDTQDLLKQLHVAPEAPLLASKLDHTKHEAVGSALPAAYQRPVSPSLTEQVKARWNVRRLALSTGICVAH